MIGAVSRQVGPYGGEMEAAVRAWGPEGIMSEPLWCARQFFSLRSGDILLKEDAADWYRSYGEGPLAEALRLVVGWRQRGEAPAAEVLRVAGLIRPATHEFLRRVAEWKGMPVQSLPPDLLDALHWVRSGLQV